MPFPRELLGKHCLLYIESDSAPGTFEQSCLFGETYDYQSDVQYEEYETRDCTQPDAPAVKRKSVKSITDSMSGTGHIKDRAEAKRMDDWHYAQDDKNIELRFHEPLANGQIGAVAITYAGPAKFARGSMTLPPGGGAIVRSASIEFQDAIVRTYAAAA